MTLETFLFSSISPHPQRVMISFESQNSCLSSLYQVWIKTLGSQLNNRTVREDLFRNYLEKEGLIYYLMGLIFLDKGRIVIWDSGPRSWSLLIAFIGELIGNGNMKGGLWMLNEIFCYNFIFSDYSSKYWVSFIGKYY